MRRSLQILLACTALTAVADPSLAQEEGRVVFRYKMGVIGEVSGPPDDGSAPGGSDDGGEGPGPGGGHESIGPFPDPDNTWPGDLGFAMAATESDKGASFFSQCFQLSGGNGNYNYYAWLDFEPSWVTGFDVVPKAMVDSPSLGPADPVYEDDAVWPAASVVGGETVYPTTAEDEACARVHFGVEPGEGDAPVVVSFMGADVDEPVSPSGPNLWSSAYATMNYAIMPEGGAMPEPGIEIPPAYVEDVNPGPLDFRIAATGSGEGDGFVYQCFEVTGGAGNRRFMAEAGSGWIWPSWVDGIDVVPAGQLSSPPADSWFPEPDWYGTPTYPTTGSSAACMRVFHEGLPPATPTLFRVVAHDFAVSDVADHEVSPTGEATLHWTTFGTVPTLPTDPGGSGGTGEPPFDSGSPVDPDEEWLEPVVEDDGEVADETLNPFGPYRITVTMTELMNGYDPAGGSFVPFYYRCYAVSGGHGNYSYRLTSSEYPDWVRYIRIVPRWQLYSFDDGVPGTWLRYPLSHDVETTGEDEVCAVVSRYGDPATDKKLTMSLYVHDFSMLYPFNYGDASATVRMTFTYDAWGWVPGDGPMGCGPQYPGGGIC